MASFQWPHELRPDMMAVDGTHCRVQVAVTRDNVAFYSWKFKRGSPNITSFNTFPGAVAYQVIVHLETEQAVHIYGPEAASTSDVVMYETSRVSDLLQVSNLSVLSCILVRGMQLFWLMVGMHLLEMYFGGAIPLFLMWLLTTREQENTTGVLACTHLYMNANCRRIKARRWKVEAFFSRMKNFRALSTPWRHALHLHR